MLKLKGLVGGLIDILVGYLYWWAIINPIINPIKE